MAKRGRPSKPGSNTVWVPEEVMPTVKAMKEWDFAVASVEFAKWMAIAQKRSEQLLDTQNKPDVN